MIYTPSDDSYLMQSVVKKFSKDKAVLDMGSGSGILAETAIQNNAKSVTAVDINPESAPVLKQKNIKYVQSDLFSSPELSKQTFDLITFNPPYLPLDKSEDIESKLTTTGGRTGDEIILRFLKQAPAHLNHKGVILLLISSLTPTKRIHSLLDKLKLNQSLVAQKKIFMESLYVLKIEKSPQG